MGLAELHSPLRSVWGASARADGDWFTQVVDRLLDFTDVGLGQTVLDMSYSPAAAIAARRRGAGVVALAPEGDAIPHFQRELISSGYSDITVREGRASAIPPALEPMDALISAFGFQFAADGEAVAREMARVVKPGGMLGLLAWQPSGGLYRFIRLLASFMPTTQPLTTIFDWGNADVAEARLGGSFVELAFKFGAAPVVAPSAGALWEQFAATPGLVHDCLSRLPAEEAQRLSLAALAQFNEYADLTGQIHWPREYLLVRGLRN